MWAHILRDQLDITAEQFWACIHNGTIPDRTLNDAADNVDDTIPVEVADLLLNRVGLHRHDILNLTRDEAIARLNEYWTTGH